MLQPAAEARAGTTQKPFLPTVTVTTQARLGPFLIRVHGMLCRSLTRLCLLVPASPFRPQVPGQSVEALLLKYARASQALPTDPLVYSAR